MTASRRAFLEFAAALGAVMALCMPATGGIVQKPNIVLILADDLGWADTGFTGSTLYRTPHLERLAGRGMYFSNAYAASPLCSPTRSSILTGLSPARSGFTAPVGHLPKVVLQAGTLPKAPVHARQRGCESVTRLSTAYVTLAEVLKDNGYATGHFGKWHLGAEPYSPLEHGFDVDIPHWPGPGPAGGFVAPWKFAHLMPRTPKEHIEDRMGDEAVAFMEQHREEPFYLNYWPFSVHAPFDAKPELIAAYAKHVDPGNPQRSATYAAMVHSLDDNVGKIMDALERLGVSDNTIIIFYSDNGGNMYDLVDGTTATSNLPLRGGKATLYEGGIRVPAIVVWPNVVKENTRSEALVQTEDLYPTILEMTGIHSAADAVCDGLSMVPALRGQTPAREAVFCYFPHHPLVPDWLPPSVCVRRGDWKLIRIFHDAPDGKQHRYELYNLRKDIGEQHNLAGQETELVRKLDAEIEAFLVRTGAVRPLPNPVYDPKAMLSVSGWQVPADGGSTLTFNERLKALQFRAFDNLSPMTTIEALALPAGNYIVAFSMLALAQGNGSVALRGKGPAGAEVGTAPFAVKHDRNWHDYQVVLKATEPFDELAIRPCSGSGTLQFSRIRILDDQKKVVKAWRGFAPAKKK